MYIPQYPQVADAQRLAAQETIAAQQKQALKQFVNDECSDAEEINTIKEDIAIQHNNITLAPSCPYVTDISGRYIRRFKYIWTR